MAKTLRKQVPIHPADRETLQRLRTENSPQAAALAVLTGITIKPDSSDAETLHALVVAGRELTEQKALESAYAREAEYARTHPDVQAWRSVMRSHHLKPSAHIQDTHEA